jgi:putative effector of murein hydrolase LrgA (UPF0299 family)
MFSTLATKACASVLALIGRTLTASPRTLAPIVPSGTIALVACWSRMHGEDGPHFIICGCRRMLTRTSDPGKDASAQSLPLVFRCFGLKPTGYGRGGRGGCRLFACPDSALCDGGGGDNACDRSGSSWPVRGAGTGPRVGTGGLDGRGERLRCHCVIAGILILLLAQLLGEAIVRLSGLPLPGPVAGLVLVLAALAVRPALADRLRPLAAWIMAHLGLMFVPAGVGVVGHLTVFRDQGAGLAVALVISTVLAILVGAGVFALVARAVGAEAESEERR